MLYMSHSLEINRETIMKLLKLFVGALLFVSTTTIASAETRITYKSAKSTSSYYQMAVEIAEAMKQGSSGDIIVTVEESQGSVQNVMEAIGRTNNYVFTTPPVLIKLARGGKAMFKDKTNPRFDDVKALFPIPSLTMHFVMSESSGVTDFAGMEGKTILIGKGSFGAKEGAKYLTLFGLEGKVTLAEVELSNAVSALKNGQIDGFVTAGSFPAPNVIEAAASAGAKVVSLNDEQVKASKRTRLVIPAGTYAGQKEDIITTSLPVVAFTTTDMDDDTAYNLTKTYWENKKALGTAAKWWNGVSLDMLSNILTDIHPGAKRYYREVGASLADHH
jgi:TRAP transporter TAXI family solute receptor